MPLYRVWLRVALLTVGAGYMGWRAFGSFRAGRELSGSEATLAQRLGWVEILMGVLCLGTAAMAAYSTRRRAPKRTLTLPRSGENAPVQKDGPPV